MREIGGLGGGGAGGYDRKNRILLGEVFVVWHVIGWLLDWSPCHVALAESLVDIEFSWHYLAGVFTYGYSRPRSRDRID